MIPIPQYPLYSATLAEYGMEQVYETYNISIITCNCTMYNNFVSSFDMRTRADTLHVCEQVGPTTCTDKTGYCTRAVYTVGRHYTWIVKRLDTIPGL